MLISENYFKYQILTGQIEILGEVLSALRKRYEEAILHKEVKIAGQLDFIIMTYSVRLEIMKKERSKVE